jgi:hypothetical protein
MFNINDLHCSYMRDLLLLAGEIPVSIESLQDSDFLLGNQIVNLFWNFIIQ